MINVLIVDDEKHCLDHLTRLISSHCADKVRVLGSCQSVEEAARAVKRLKPDLIFLDVQLQDKSGFDLLEQIDNRIPVIFTTAFQEYAVMAFRFSAIDYLLKPINKDELLDGIDKAMDNIAQRETAERYATLFHNLKTDTPLRRISLPTAGGYDYVPVNDVIRCQASGNYTLFFLTNGTRLTVARTLKVFEFLLDGCNFFRVHHAHLVNLNYVKQYRRDGFAVMSDSSEVEVSVRRKEAFLARMALNT